MKMKRLYRIYFLVIILVDVGFCVIMNGWLVVSCKYILCLWDMKKER